MNLLVSRKRLLGNIGDFLWSYGGYLIVSALCDLCGVVLDKSNTRNFVSGCIESLYDTLKTNLSVDGANYALSLNDELISEFIDFYLSVGAGKQYLYNKGDECTSITGGWERKTNENTSLFPSDYFKKEDAFMQLYTERGAHNVQFGTVNKINISNHKKILFEIEKIQCSSGANLYIEFVDAYSSNVWNSKHYRKNNNASNFDNIFTISMDIEDTFEYKDGYIGIFTDGFTDNLKFNITKAWLGNKYDIGDSYVKSSEEYKAKYEKEPTEIVLDSSIVNIKTKWKEESTDIYIPDGNVENLPDGVSIVYKKYLFKEGNECTDITGGWGKYYTDTHWYWNSANSKGGNVDNTILLNMESGTSNGALCSLGTNEKIDFSKYSKIGIEYSAVVDDIVASAYIVFRLQIRDNYSGSEIQPSVRNWLLKSTGNLEIFTEAEFNLGNINEMLYLVPILISERWRTGSARIKKIWLE